MLVARDGRDVAEHVRSLTPERARSIGEAARRRVLAEHTYERRGAEVDALLTSAAAAKVREERGVTASLSGSSSSASACPRPGATATRRPIARCCARSPRAATT